MAQQRVLMVTTSTDRLGDNIVELTGAWAAEVAVSFYMFRAKGYDVKVASMKGGPVPFDPASLTAKYKSNIVNRFFDDEEVRTLITNSISISYVDASAFDVLFIVGGHGIMWDGVHNKELTRLIEAFWEAHKPVATCSQGSATLLDAMVTEPGGGYVPLLKGQKVTAPSRKEEEMTGRVEWLPFLLEERMKLAGARFQYAEGSGIPYAVKSGLHLITGQNHESIEKVVQLIIEDTSFGVRMTL